METGKLEERIRLLASEQFSRSGGPGGQNVNKVNTRVTLRLPVRSIGFSDEEFRLLTARLAGRINAAGELVIHCSDTRSQSRNRELVLDRAFALILEALVPVELRRLTKPSRGAHERRLTEKRKRSARKMNRGKPSPDGD